MDQFAYNGTQSQVYQLTTGRKLLYLIMSAFYIGLSGFFLLKSGPNSTGRDWIDGMSLIFILAAIFLAAYALRTRLVLTGDQMEFRSTLRTRTLDRNQIEGIRTMRTRNGSYTRFYLKDNQGTFTIPASITNQDGVSQWLQSVTNLDQRDADKITSELSREQTIASGQTDPSALLGNAKIAMYVLTAVAIVASFLAFRQTPPLFFPSVIVLWLLPLVGIGLLYRFPLLYAVFKQKADPRAELSLAIMIPGFGLLFAFSAGESSHILHSSQILIWIAVIFIAFVVALLQPALSSVNRTGAVIGILVAGALYSIGVIHTADTLPDHSIPEPFQAQVLDMHESHGRSTSYYLSIAPWGPVTNGTDVEVSYHTYHSVSPGDTVCINLHSGYLQAPWYTLHTCPQ
ncbi:MAG: hypothetical protein ACP5M4_11025 [Acidobacteriaceae bacterium]